MVERITIRLEVTGVLVAVRLAMVALLITITATQYRLHLRALQHMATVVVVNRIQPHTHLVAVVVLVKLATLMVLVMVAMEGSLILEMVQMSTMLAVVVAVRIQPR